jgi:hypothetical protein
MASSFVGGRSLLQNNASTCRWTKWEAFYFDDPLDHHYNMMIDSGADPEEVVSNPKQFCWLKKLAENHRPWASN